jgi:hypothetical protein
MRLLACLLLCLVARPAAPGPSLAGTWFGQGQPDNKESMYLDHMLPNGQIHSQFRTCHQGKAYGSTEDGTWSVAGNILTIQVALHDGIPMPRADTYRLESVTVRQFNDVYLPLNFPYEERRVDDKFTMPGCQLVG